jgi:hypothetical protein
LKYFILHHLLLAFGDHFIHPNSYIPPSILLPRLWRPLPPS